MSHNINEKKTYCFFGGELISSNPLTQKQTETDLKWFETRLHRTVMCRPSTTEDITSFRLAGFDSIAAPAINPHLTLIKKTNNELHYLPVTIYNIDWYNIIKSLWFNADKMLNSRSEIVERILTKEYQKLTNGVNVEPSKLLNITDGFSPFKVKSILVIFGGR